MALILRILILCFLSAAVFSSPGVAAYLSKGLNRAEALYEEAAAKFDVAALQRAGALTLAVKDAHPYKTQLLYGKINTLLAQLAAEGLVAAGLPAEGVQLVATTDRAAVGALIAMPQHVDIIVPRGGKGLIERLMRESKVPMIKHLDGICHVYVDGAADVEMAVRIADNAKTQRYGVCNAMETLLVAQPIAEAVLPSLGRIYADKGVELRGCPATVALLRAAGVDCVAATEDDWSTEYLGPILSVRVLSGLEEAIEHINRYGSRHTDAIVTNDHHAAMRFLREVDSASVMVNASTRFADGFEYGLGAEIGISNDKLHARGPVGLEGLTSLKYVVFGAGEVRN